MKQGRKRKKRGAGTASAAAKDPAILQTGRGSKKMDPLARRLLYAAVILVAAAQVLDTVLQIIPRTAGDIITIVGVLLLVGFFIVQARSGAPGQGLFSGGKGRRL